MKFVDMYTKLTAATNYIVDNLGHLISEFASQDVVNIKVTNGLIFGGDQFQKAIIIYKSRFETPEGFVVSSFKRQNYPNDNGLLTYKDIESLVKAMKANNDIESVDAVVFEFELTAHENDQINYTYLVCLL